MDTFMDKLAQKLNAQEMIKANAAAEAAELSRLREQTESYEALLAKMAESGEKSITGAEKLSISAGTMEQSTALLTQGVARIEQSVAQTAQNAEKVEQGAVQIAQGAGKVEQGAAQIAQGAGKVEQSAEKVAQSAEKIENTAAKTEELIAAAIAKIEEIQAKDQDTEALNELLEELKKLQSTQYEQLTDHVHKESVKVYRNVQAVILDEVTKFNGTTGKSMLSVSGKIGAVLWISIIAMLVSVAGLAFQILVYLHII